MSEREREFMVRVRHATFNEASSIALVLNQAFIEYRPLYTAEAFAMTVPTTEQIEKRWNEGPIWMAGQDDRLLGTVAAMSKDVALYIRSMAVLPSARGEGVGYKLLDEVERFALASGVRRMFLSTIPFLHQAIRLYERYGFVRTEEGPHDLVGTSLYTMEKIANPVSSQFA